MCGGGKAPPYRAAETGKYPINPAWRAPLPGGMYAAPTNTRYRVHEPKNVAMGQTGTGRMHAAHTNRPGTAGERVKQASAADRPACERGRGFRTGARMSLAGCKESFA